MVFLWFYGDMDLHGFHWAHRDFATGAAGLRFSATLRRALDESKGSPKTPRGASEKAS